MPPRSLLSWSRRSPLRSRWRHSASPDRARSWSRTSAFAEIQQAAGTEPLQLGDDRFIESDRPDEPRWRWPWRRSGSSRFGRPVAPAYESDLPTSILWSPTSRRGCVAALAIASRTSLTRGSSNSASGETPRSRKVEANQQSGGKHWPQSLLQRSARKRADNSVELLPVPDDNEQRDRLRAKPRGESWIRVDIDLHDLQVSRVTVGQVLEHGRDHPTRPAPRRPEINHHGHGRGRLGRERGAVRVDDPRQIGLAARASRHSLGDRGDPVARIAGRAADDRHDDQVRAGRSLGRLATPSSG